MDKWHKFLGLTLAVTVIVSAGCSGRSPFQNLLAKKDKPAVNKPAAVGAGRGVGHKPPAKEEGIADGIASSWKSMTGKVSDALTIKPKEQEPADPTSLDSDPGPINPSLFVATAELLEGGGKFDQAKQQYAKALEVDPNHRAALIGIARLHDRQGDFATAEKSYIRAIKAHPGQADFYNDLGLCLARQRKVELAAGILNKAVELDPQRVLYRNNLATVLVDQGKHDEALKHFSVAQDKAVAHYNLGYLLSKRHENEAAVRHLQIASQMKPGFTQAQQMLAKLEAQTPPSAVQPAVDSPTYRITDREQMVTHTKPRIPTRLTSGVMLSRLPATDESEEEKLLGIEKAAPEHQPAPPADESLPAEQSKLADEPPAETAAEQASEQVSPLRTGAAAVSAASRNSAFIPAQPDQMTPPVPTE